MNGREKKQTNSKRSPPSPETKSIWVNRNGSAATRIYLVLRPQPSVHFADWFFIYRTQLGIIVPFRDHSSFSFSSYGYIFAFVEWLSFLEATGLWHVEDCCLCFRNNTKTYLLTKWLNKLQTSWAEQAHGGKRCPRRKKKEQNFTKRHSLRKLIFKYNSPDGWENLSGKDSHGSRGSTVVTGGALIVRNTNKNTKRRKKGEWKRVPVYLTLGWLTKDEPLSLHSLLAGTNTERKPIECLTLGVGPPRTMADVRKKEIDRSACLSVPDNNWIHSSRMGLLAGFD